MIHNKKQDKQEVCAMSAEWTDCEHMPIAFVHRIHVLRACPNKVQKLMHYVATETTINSYTETQIQKMRILCFSAAIESR